jgi:hypothetical protein
MSVPLVINGKTYPFWQQFIDRKDEWIGGQLIDDAAPEEPTLITDVTLGPNGNDSAIFHFEGKDFNCGFDVHHGGIRGDSLVENGLHFYMYGGGFIAIRNAKARGE